MYVPQQPYWANMWLVQREVSSGILGIIQLPQSSLKKDLCRAVLKHQGRSLLPAGQPWKAWMSSVILAVANCCTSRACPQLSMKSFQHSWEADMTCPSEHVLASTHAWQEGPQQEDSSREPQAYSFPNIPSVQGAGLVRSGGEAVVSVPLKTRNMPLSCETLLLGPAGFPISGKGSLLCSISLPPL